MRISPPIRLPKSNVAWEVTQDGLRRQVEVRASFRMPNGETLHNSLTLPEETLYDERVTEHSIERLLTNMEREVGRKMVRG